MSRGSQGKGRMQCENAESHEKTRPDSEYRDSLETRFLEGGSVVSERRANTSRSYTSRDGERNHGVKISNWFLN